jgi:hypothetical protein
MLGFAAGGLPRKFRQQLAQAFQRSDGSIRVEFGLTPVGTEYVILVSAKFVKAWKAGMLRDAGKFEVSKPEFRVYPAATRRGFPMEQIGAGWEQADGTLWLHFQAFPTTKPVVIVRCSSDPAPRRGKPPVIHI